MILLLFFASFAALREKCLAFDLNSYNCFTEIDCAFNQECAEAEGSRRKAWTKGMEINGEADGTGFADLLDLSGRSNKKRQRINGGADGTRTRDLLRDRQAF